ncbi:MAG: VOC family protein [Terriglobales bacterium]
MATASTKAHYIPAGYHTATPYLMISKGKAAQALDWYREVFGAAEVMRFPMPDGRIGHAETKIGDSHIMLADEYPEMGYQGPETLGGSPGLIMLYVENVDSVFKRAIEHGAKVKQEVKDQFYGDRNGTITDPFGHHWTLSTHFEDVTPEEMKRRMASMQK